MSKKIKPSTYHQKQIEQGMRMFDEAQMALLERLDDHHHLIQPTLLAKFSSHPKGLYVWGKVGIGKSMLLSALFDLLSCPKTRLHFHAFMKKVHQALDDLRGHQDPLPEVAKAWAKENRVLYLDELVVSNIADAMILKVLFSALVAHGVFLLISANRAPDALYHGGVNRTAFLPAIDWIEQTLEVYHMPSSHDYREDMEKQKGLYVTPISNASASMMQAQFEHWANGDPTDQAPLEICGRPLDVKQSTSSVLWCDFDTLCKPPRSQMDYLALVETYSFWLISGLPILEKSDQIDLLIKLIDILYEADCTLALEASVPISDLAPEGPLAFQFERTLSRLKVLTGIE